MSLSGLCVENREKLQVWRERWKNKNELQINYTFLPLIRRLWGVPDLLSSICGKEKLIHIFSQIFLAPIFKSQVFQRGSLSSHCSLSTWGLLELSAPLANFNLIYKLSLMFVEARDFHALGEKKVLHEGKTTSHFGKCNEKKWTFPANSFLWAMNK